MRTGLRPSRARRFTTNVALPHGGQQLVEREAARTSTRYFFLEEPGAAGVGKVF